MNEPKTCYTAAMQPQSTDQSTANRIALIIPYFGKWPDWMPAFLATCATNPEVDWFLFTDCGTPDALPPNVHCFPCTLDQINALASRKLGFPVRLQRPYKLCDLKPAYGLLFDDRLEPFSFWGHCDLDVLWGRIRHFLPDRHLDRYDILSSRRHALAGHFCIYRNQPRINRLCLDLPGWEQIINDNDRSYMLDEAGFVDLLKEKISGGDPVRIDWHRTLATSGSDQRPLLCSGMRFQWKRGRPVDPDGRPTMWRHWLFRGKPMRWIHGRAYDSFGRERMYLHFHRLKGGFTRPCDIAPGRAPRKIMIRKEGISGE